MGKLHRVVLGCLLACACSRAGKDASAGGGEPLTRVELAQTAPEVDPRFDAKGELKPSPQRVGFLEIPMGFQERPGSTPREGAFEASDMPVEKLRDYLESRITAGSIEFPRGGVAYRFAKPVHSEVSSARVHVRVAEIDRAEKRVRLLVEDLTPLSTPQLSLEAVQKLLAEDRLRGQ